MTQARRPLGPLFPRPLMSRLTSQPNHPTGLAAANLVTALLLTISTVQAEDIEHESLVHWRHSETAGSAVWTGIMPLQRPQKFLNKAPVNAQTSYVMRCTHLLEW